jgi:DNA-binding beta-propeller fold protein YncE
VVVNKDESTVSIVDLGSAAVLATLPTGAGPHECAASANGRWAVVTNYGTRTPGSSLTVIDLETLTVARTMDLGFTRPHGIAFLPDHQTVAVTSETGRAVVLADVATGTVTNIVATDQHGSHMVAVGSDGRAGYTANIGSGSLSALDLAAPAKARVLPVGPETEAIALSPDGREVWLGSNSTGRVFVVDVDRWVVADSIQTAGHPYRIGFTPDQRLALVTNPFSDEVQIIDPAGKRILIAIRTPGEGGRAGQPFGLAFAPDSRTAWITLRGAGQVVELDLMTRRVRRYLPAGRGPDGIAYTERPGVTRR